MKQLDKKVVDLAKAIYCSKVAATHMEPTTRRETPAIRKQEFKLLATRAFVAASSFFDTQEYLENIPEPTAAPTDDLPPPMDCDDDETPMMVGRKG